MYIVAQFVFYSLLVARFFYPFMNSPMNHMVGLPRRQWVQAGNFWNPDLMAGVDSFFYQLWLSVARFLSYDHPMILTSMNGLLCAAMPLCWHLCARTMLPKGWAIATALVIAVTPSFLTIYAYFASETLLLPLVGLACWQTARCWQTRSSEAFFWAALFWGFAAFTRVIALPPAIVCLVVLCIHLRFPWKVLIPASVLLVGLGWGSAWHSHQAIGVYAPFGMPEMNAVFTRSQAMRLHVALDDNKDRWFRSPAFHMKPFAPFSDWHIRDLKPPAMIEIDSKKGMEDWERGLERYPLTWDRIQRQVSLNVIFALLGPSWPDTWPGNWGPNRKGSSISALEEDINYHARWMWALLIPFVFVAAARYRGGVLPHAFIVLTMSMVLLLFFQFSSVLEGRYRKPVEPMLIISAALLLQQRYGERGMRG